MLPWLSEPPGRCSPRAPRLIRNSIVSSDLKWKVNGKTAVVKGRLSTVSGAGVNLTSVDGSPSFDVYSKFLRQRRILEEDSSSDNSSLISSNSDEGSCSTDSTSDSTSTDDFADYIFGDLGRGSGSMFRNSDSKIAPSLSSSPHSRYFPSFDIWPTWFSFAAFNWVPTTSPKFKGGDRWCFVQEHAW